LHGFASSALSSKARFFRERLTAQGVTVHCPDLNEPDFSTLTISRMLEQVLAGVSALPPEPLVLIGSSLGAFVAVQAALRLGSRVDRMVLLAPALDLGGRRMETMGDRGIEEWQATNQLNVFHYGYGRIIPVHFELYTDAARYDALGAQLAMPVQIFQGRRDTAVDPACVERWASTRPNVELHMLDDDHQLHASLETIWREAASFLGLAPGPYQQIPS
jgi:pimeloyl-ACP methyl ester carboxylesterase